MGEPRFFLGDLNKGLDNPLPPGWQWCSTTLSISGVSNAQGFQHLKGVAGPFNTSAFILDFCKLQVSIVMLSLKVAPGI